MITRRTVRRLLSPLLSAAALLAYAGPAAGQTLSTWTGATNGNWNAANWDVAPVSGADTEIIFEGTVQTITNQNFPGTFQLTNLTLGGTATNGFTVTGNPLSFVPGTNPAGIFNVATKRLILNTPINIGAAFTATPGSEFNLGLFANDTQGAELFLGGPITGSGYVKVAPASDPATTAVIRSANNTGFTGTWAITGASSTMLGAVNALFRQSTVTLAASANSTFFAGTTTAADVGNQQGIIDKGYNQQLGSVSGAGQFLLGTSGSASAGSTVLVGYSDTDMILNGSASLSGINPASHFGKVGAGILTLRSTNNAYNAGLSIRAGTFTIATLTPAVGSLNGTSAAQYTIYGGGQFRLNNATALAAGITAGRLNNLANIVSAGGIFRFDGSATASASNTEVVASYASYAGLGVVAVNANAAQFAAITFANATTSFDAATLTRGGQTGFAGPALGAGVAAGQSGVNFTVAPAQVGGILPWSLAQTSYTTAPTAASVTFVPDTFATYGANGIAPLTTFDGSNVLATGVTALPATINSLIIGAGGSATANGTAVTAGAILSRVPAGTVDGTGVTTVGRFYLSATPGTTPGSLVVTAPITAGGVSTSGAVSLGVVNLTGTNPVLSVNSGVTTLTGAVTPSTIYQVAAAGNLTTPLLTVNGAGGTLRGNGVVTGNVVVQSGGLIGATALAGDNTAGQSPGILTIAGSLTLEPGSNFRFYINSVHGDTNGSLTNGQWTQAKINATAINFTGDYSVSKITVQPWGLDLKNGAGNAAIYDFDNTKEYFWVLANGNISNFSSDKFTVNTAFQNFNTNNPPGNGSYEVIQQGNNIVLHFNPVPEPALMGFGALGVLAFVTRRRKA